MYVYKPNKKIDCKMPRFRCIQIFKCLLLNIIVANIFVYNVTAEYKFFFYKKERKSVEKRLIVFNFFYIQTPFQSINNKREYLYILYKREFVTQKKIKFIDFTITQLFSHYFIFKVFNLLLHYQKCIKIKNSAGSQYVYCIYFIHL